MPDEATKTIDYTTGTPWICSDLDGVVTAETKTSLKDDFALAINKDTILKTEIPEGYPYGGTVMNIVLQNAKDMPNMYKGDAPKEHDSLLAFNMFGLMMDWEGRNRAGIAPAKKLVDAIEEIDSLEGLKKYILETPFREQMASLWDGGSSIDFKNSDAHILAVENCSLMLKDSAEYIKLTEYGKIVKEAKVELVEKLLKKFGYSEEEAKKKIDNCLTYETRLAPGIPSKEKQSEPDYMASTYNIFSYEQLKEAQGNVPILEFLEKEGFPREERYQVYSHDFVKLLNENFTEENLTLLKDYLIVHTAIESADYLDRDCYEYNIECSNKITGATGMRPDEVVFCDSIAEMLEWPVARLYTERYLKKEDKDRLTRVCKEIVESYHDIINGAEFLSDETKKKAIEKLEAIDLAILYPDNWEKYSFEKLNYKSAAEGGLLYDAVLNTKAFLHDKLHEEHFKPVDKTKWVMPPHTVNCFYLGLYNTVYILGAFCKGAMYDSSMSDEEVYGRIGWVIGHEVSHAFDSSGAQFDKDGNMTDWWTEEDYAALKQRSAKMEAYFNSMHPWEGQDFHGNIMTGEGCADMGGMKAILNLAKKKENFDYDKLFRALGEVWLTRGTLQKALHQITDTHPMGYLRVNCTLQQFDEFLECYGIKEGDGMYLAPEERVAIW
ncbi:M13-type metalloendopeptidase [Butyrivibrio sp. AE3004]|uniref:M13-type metalloendopeptidase n=1 Tax=Butyrivibrio sp. AE3004 TaxID=1506994 RepID=UPI000493D13F|nr:M13 family metallopeptidase [Butyrivibrio sp. AE3004]